MIQQAGEEAQNRYEIGTDTAIGASFSLTAAIVAWTLHGGALLGSLMALQPLWASVDPIKAATNSRDKKNVEEESEVEDIFD